MYEAANEEHDVPWQGDFCEHHLSNIIQANMQSYYWDPACRLDCSQKLFFYHTQLLPGWRRNHHTGSVVWQASARYEKCKISLLEWVWFCWAEPEAHSWSFQSQQKGHGSRRQGNILLVAYFLSANEWNYLKTEKWCVKSMEKLLAA